MSILESLSYYIFMQLPFKAGVITVKCFLCAGFALSTLHTVVHLSPPQELHNIITAYV